MLRPKGNLGPSQIWPIQFVPYSLSLEVLGLESNQRVSRERMSIYCVVWIMLGSYLRAMLRLVVASAGGTV